MCISSMAGDDERGRQSRQTVAVTLVLCTLAQSLTCFSLPGLSKKVKQDKLINEATPMEVQTGNILFSGKELDSQSVSASTAATGNDGLLDIDSDQSHGTRMLEQISQLEDTVANEAAWRRLNLSLHCGQNKMKLKAMGPGAVHLQLDMGKAHPLPLLQVPETCSYSMKQNALGLVLVVPYDGCNVIQENGNFVLPMIWLETPVKITCPMFTSSATAPASTTPKPAQQPWKLPFLHRPWSLNRHKRHMTNQPMPIYDPPSPYYPYLYYYYMYMMALAPGTATTAKPDMTMTTKPATEKPPQIKPPAYPYYYYYPYYPYYPLPNVPVKTTTPPTTTTAKPTTGPVTSETATTAKMTTTTTTTAKMTTTTASESTTKTAKPYYPPYFPYPYFQEIPENSDIYYYPVIQNFYGKPPYPQIPMQTTLPSTPTTKPGDSSPTTKPTTASAPTTSAASMVQTTKACSSTTKPSNNYPGSMSPYVPYYQLPFTPYISYKYNKASKFPADQKYMPQADYKSGLQARAHPPPHPGFHYLQPVPWFPLSPGQNSQSDWKNLQPKYV